MIAPCYVFLYLKMALSEQIKVWHPLGRDLRSFLFLQNCFLLSWASFTAPDGTLWEGSLSLSQSGQDSTDDQDETSQDQIQEQILRIIRQRALGLSLHCLYCLSVPQAARGAMLGMVGGRYLEGSSKSRAKFSVAFPSERVMPSAQQVI